MAKKPNIVLFPVQGDIDVTSSASVRKSLDELIDSGCRRIILNMAQVNYIDSCGMAVIIHAIAKMRAAGGLLSLTHVCPPVLHILTLARVVDFIPVSSTHTSVEIPGLDPSTQPLWRHVVRIDASNLAATRSKVTHLLRRLAFSANDLFDMELAIGEAIGNAVDHGAGCSLVSVFAYPDRAVIEISDCGCGLLQKDTEEASRVAQQVSSCTDNSSDIWFERGRGIKLMRLLADSVSFSNKKSGSGTVVRIVKLIHSRDNMAEKSKL